ncbi:MAG: DUF2065 domain-containing protein [Steroidobacteraceae bacterium]
MFSWSDLLAAFALYLVLEGIMPFLNPTALRRALASFTELSDAQLRVLGLLSMLAGVVLLYFVRH